MSVKRELTAGGGGWLDTSTGAHNFYITKSFEKEGHVPINSRHTQSMKLSIDQNQCQSITINRLIFEIDEQSMKEDSVTFKRYNSQISIANRWKSM